jgi:uncharacterized repeat protein (TIGR01451 family)
MLSNDQPPTLPWRAHLLIAVAGALLIFALALLGARSTPAAWAQAGPPVLSMAITKTLQGSSVVRVGEYITFTIRITNTGNISITQLPVIDEFDAKVLRLDGTAPAASTAGNGQITWTNLPTDTNGGPLPPGGSVLITTRFRIIGISNLTINRVRVQDARGQGGLSGGSGSGQGGGTTQGGRVILTKGLAPGSVPVSGQPITFTISARNYGAADLLTVPIQDIYTPDYLRFWKAIPPPSQVLTGELRWDNVLQSLGLARLHPNEAITITTVFTPVKALDGGNVNRAGAVGVRDEFQNQLAAPREAEVPIRILPAPSSATPRPRSRSDQATPTEEVVATPTAEVTATAALSATDQLSATVAITPTSAALPARLPRTGGGGTASLAWGLVGLALLLGGALGLLRLRRARRSE